MQVVCYFGKPADDATPPLSIPIVDPEIRSTEQDDDLSDTDTDTDDENITPKPLPRSVAPNALQHAV